MLLSFVHCKIKTCLRPFHAGTAVIALLEIASNNKSVTPSRVDILADDYRIIQSVANISQLSSNNFAAIFMSPKESFTLHFLGKDKSGYKFSHISDTFFDVSSVHFSLGKYLY